MGLSKTFTNYDAMVYGMLLSILIPNEKDSKRSEKLTGQIANGCNEKEVDRAMDLVDSIMELIQLETTRVRYSNKSKEK